MKNELKVDELNEIEKQLSCPYGENGIKIAEMMHTTNIGMTSSSIKSLKLNINDTILELGHGNCGHLNLILKAAKLVTYYGLEISETMQNQAKEINKKYLQNKQAFFSIYDGLKIPYPSNNFDKLMTVNTLYFWKHPIEFLNEIHRVLKPNGTFVLTFADKHFMKKLPFIKEKFTLYDDVDIKKLILKSNLTLTKCVKKTEQIKSKTGEFITRDFYIVKAKK